MPDIKLGALVYQMAIRGQAKVNQQVGKLQKGFGAFEKKLQGVARRVPIIGDQLAALKGPQLIAAAGFAAVSAAIALTIARVSNMEKALRPMIERSGIAGESLQILSQAATEAGSEDGLEGVTDSAQEMQLRLSEAAVRGAGPAADALEELGINAQDYLKLRPEEAFLRLVKALQNVDDEAHRKLLADDLMGGSSEKLAGLLSLTNAQLDRQLEHIRETGDYLDESGIATARRWNDTWEEGGANFGRVLTLMGTALQERLQPTVEGFNDTADFTRSLFERLGPAADESARSVDAYVDVFRNLAVETGLASVEQEKQIKNLVKLESITLQNRMAANEKFKENYRLFIDAQIAAIEELENKKKFEFEADTDRLSRLNLATRRAADERNRILLSEAQEAARIRDDRKEAERLALIEEIKNNVEREKLMTRFKVLSADIQDEIREEAYQHGRKLQDVIKEYLDDILRVQWAVDNQRVDAVKTTGEEIVKATEDTFGKLEQVAAVGSAAVAGAVATSYSSGGGRALGSLGGVGRNDPSREGAALDARIKRLGRLAQRIANAGPDTKGRLINHYLDLWQPGDPRWNDWGVFANFGINRPTPNAAPVAPAHNERSANGVTGTLRITDGFTDMVGEAMINLEERGG